MSIENIMWLSGVAVCAFFTLVQKISGKYKPWTWIAERFGEAVNKKMLDKLTELEDKIDKLEETDRKQNEERDKQLALDARRRILGTADEIRKHVRHSEEFFGDALNDVSYYRKYCRVHPEFENSKAVISSKIIEDTYQQCIFEDDFE